MQNSVAFWMHGSEHKVVAFILRSIIIIHLSHHQSHSNQECLPSNYYPSQNQSLVLVFISKVHKEFQPFIEMPSIYSLSDSIVELPCVHGNGKPIDTFVRKRLDEVQKLVNVTCWHYVESMEICSIQQTLSLEASFSRNYCRTANGFKDHITFTM